MQQDSLLDDATVESSKGPVECLGQTFENEEARREHFTKLLAEKLKDPEFRKIEGFPIGTDEAILELSDPPYYTACPNPLLNDFVEYWKVEPKDTHDEYHRDPFTADVSEGKNDPIYNAHSYHTKVPHRAIMRYILHYTNAGDTIFDGFCGTGMTGVAAQMCGDKAVVESLGYVVKDSIIYEATEDGKLNQVSTLGVRHALLNDLSPAATFISKNYNTPGIPAQFVKDANNVLANVKKKCSWMYETRHGSTNEKGIINYTVWSDIFSCPECSGDIVFWKVAVDEVNGKVRNEFNCPGCQSLLTKKSLKKRLVKKLDESSNEVIEQMEQYPVRINYKVGTKNHDKIPDSEDFEVIKKIESQAIKSIYPSDELPDGFNTRQPKNSHGYNKVHHFYTKRNLLSLVTLKEEIDSSNSKAQLLCLVGDQLPRASKMHKIAISRLNTNLSKTAGILAGTLYIPSNQIEYNLLSMVAFRIKDVSSYLSKRDNDTKQIVSTGSSNNLLIKDNSIDYFFFDPPFGANLNYSELNFLWEAWLRVFTNNKQEAIENKIQNKSLNDYRYLMQSCFEEAFRILKPGRWMTVEFSNTKSSVWNSIQSALQESGFIVANVSALDKKQHTIKALTSSTAVKQDLVISAYKPNNDVIEMIKSGDKGLESAWDFIEAHLSYLPISKIHDGRLVNISERDPRILFDQLISVSIRKGIQVPFSSQEFQLKLSAKFVERDGMVFLPSQVAEYDKKRATLQRTQQLSIFVDDEASAIEWLRQELKLKPKTYSEINPLFLHELSGWKKNELQLELMTLLEQNFIKYDGNENVPNQIHTYLSTNFKDMRSLSKDSAFLKAKAKDRWYVPDPSKAGDIEKLRVRALLREFDVYKEEKKKIKQPRAEALRAGFNACWEKQDLQTILDISAKIPPAVLQEDEKLLMFYDNALTLTSNNDDDWD